MEKTEEEFEIQIPYIYFYGGSIMKSFFNNSIQDNDSVVLRKRRNSFTSLQLFCWILYALLLGSNTAFSQSYYTQNEKDGFVLKKIVSNTTVNSGQDFTYSIHFSIPSGATNVVISDAIPGSLEFRGSTFAIFENCTGTALTAVETKPTLNQRGGNYELSVPNAPCGGHGSFTISVRFPIGITCDSTLARNQVCVKYTINNTNSSFCTDFVLTYASAKSTWKVAKYVVDAVNQGGVCPNVVNDSIITYKIDVYKDWGDKAQLSLVGGTVTDVLPAGATFISSTCGATVSGSTITWYVGNITPTNSYNKVTCNFTIHYPTNLYPIGSQIYNNAILIASTGDSLNSCGSIDENSLVCSEVKGFTNGHITKTVKTNSQPGCGGTYTIKLCNTGTDTLKNIIVRDTLPTYITYGSLDISTLPAGWTATGGSITTLSSGTQSLASGDCVTLKIHFTISLSAPTGTNINNCAYLYATGIDTAKESCVSFKVKEAKPILCLEKEVCNKKVCYSPGDTITYRLRIQNIGGVDISGATITDIIDKNLEYIGFPRSYSNPTYSAVCGTQTDSWGHPLNAAYIGSLHKLTFTVPTIPFNCDAYGSCGQNDGTVPYYFFEFKVKVSDSSAIGPINNQFAISGGTLPDTVKSKIVTINVCADVGYWIEKEVKRTDSVTYGSTATIANGGAVDYRLSLHIPIRTLPLKPLAALRNVSFIEELPKDVSTTVDKYLMTCNSRNSLFGLSFTGSFTSSPNPLAVPVKCNIPVSGYPRIKTWGLGSPNWAPPSIFIGGCPSMLTSVWTPTSVIAPNTKNNGFYYNQWAFIPSATDYPWIEFKAKADSADVRDSIACNTFVAGATVRHIINGTTYFEFPIGEVESQPVCVIKSTSDTLYGTIFGEKFWDIDCDGIKDSLEPGLPGWVITLYQGGTTLSMTTDNNGNYEFPSVPEGKYNLSETPQAGWTQTYPDGDGTWTGTIIGNTGIRRDFGNCKDSIPTDSSSCIDFEEGNNPTTTNWHTENVDNKAITTEPGYGNVIEFTDGNDGSIAINNVDFNGDWVEKSDSGCLCFDYKVDWNEAVGSNAGSAPHFAIYYSPVPATNNAGFINTLRASFIGNSSQQIIDNEWAHYCLPQSECINGQLPSNSYGHWEIFNNNLPVTGAQACTDWNTLIHNVTGIRLLIDYNDQPSELVYFDNFCWECTESIPNPSTSCSCDSLQIGPYSNPQTSRFEHQYTVINQKGPQSDICDIYLSISPSPIGTTSGGHVLADGNLQISSFQPNPISGNYEHIDLSPAAHSDVSFFYGVDWFSPGQYIVTITVVHCDGDTCVYQDTLNPHPPVSIPGTVVFEEIKDNIKAFRFNLKGSKKLRDTCKHILIDLDDTVGKIVAVTSKCNGLGDCDSDIMDIADSKMNKNRVLFTLAKPLALSEGEISKPLTVVWSQNPDSQVKPNIKVTLFNEKGDPIGFDSTDIISSVDVENIFKGFEGSEFELLRSVPNPAQDKITLYYILGTQADIRLGLFDNLGNELKSYNEGFKTQGIHYIDINTSDLISGAYHARLISPTRSATLKLIINK